MSIAGVIFIPNDESLLAEGIGGFRPSVALRHPDCNADDPWFEGRAEDNQGCACSDGRPYVRGLLLAWGGKVARTTVSFLGDYLQAKVNSGESAVPWEVIQGNKGHRLVTALNTATVGAKMGHGKAVYVNESGLVI